MTVVHSTHASDSPEQRLTARTPVSQLAITASLARLAFHDATDRTMDPCYGDAASLDTPATSQKGALCAGDGREWTQELPEGLL